MLSITKKHGPLSTEVKGIAYDSRLVKALANGLPDCAGVALGVDRLLMLALNKNAISEVMPFDFSRA